MWRTDLEAFLLALEEQDAADSAAKAKTVAQRAQAGKAKVEWPERDKQFIHGFNLLVAS